MLLLLFSLLSLHLFRQRKGQLMELFLTSIHLPLVPYQELLVQEATQVQYASVSAFVSLKQRLRSTSWDILSLALLL